MKPVAMISGASRGIGATIAQDLLDSGWLLSLGVRDPGRIPPALVHDDVLVHHFDALDAGSEACWVASTVERFGRVDAVINNAGVMVPKSVIEAEDDDIDAVLGVNVKSPLRLVRAAWPHLTATGRGRVVTIASLSGKRVKTAKSGLYAVSKFAALGLAHAIRHAGFADGVRSTAICPGFVATDMARALTEIDAGEMTQPQDIARLVRLVLELPNSASIAEIPVNCALDDSF